MRAVTDNKNNPTQIANSILLLTIGLSLLWAALWINTNIKIKVMPDFGHRELAHFIGLTSLTILFWFFIVSPLEKTLFYLNIFLGTLIIFLPISTYFLWPEEMSIYIGYIHVRFLMTLLPLYAAGLVIAWSLGKYGSLSAHSAIWWAVITCCVISFAWEVVIQPHFEVYGGPPRGSIQWQQVICDAFGAALGAWLIYRIAGTRKVGTTAKT